MQFERVGVGVVGAGNISDQYLSHLTTFPDFDVLFVADLVAERAASQAKKYGVPASGSLAELLTMTAFNSSSISPSQQHMSR